MTKKPTKPFTLEPEDRQNLFYSKLAKAADEIEKMRANPALAKQKIDRYKARLPALKTEASMGNVAAKEDIKTIKSRIDRLYREFLPDEWKKIQDRKARARANPRVRASTRRTVSQGIDIEQAAEKNPTIARKMANGFREFRDTNYAAPDFVYSMLASAKVSIIRSVLQNLSKEELEQAKDIASQIRTERSPRDAYTEKQKERVIKLLDSEIAKK